VLRDDVMTIDDREILVMKEDDPDTAEDESEEVDTRLSPRIRVELEPEFFQQILDREGSEVLSTRSNFQEFIKGLRFSVGDLSDDMLMLLDWNNASVEVVYTYEREDTSSDND